MDKKKNKLTCENDKYIYDNYAFVKDMKIPRNKKKKIKKSDIFITNDNKTLEPIGRKKTKNGVLPYQKPDKRGVVEMW